MSSNLQYPPSAITGKPTQTVIVDYTINRTVKKFNQNFTKLNLKEKDKDILIKELISEISEKINESLIEYGYGYGEDDPVIHYSTKIHDQTEKAVSRLFNSTLGPTPKIPSKK